MEKDLKTHIRVLIVDDERLARANLKGLLKEHSYVSVVGEARNITEARKILDEVPVDLIFLDIQMPGGSGFDLLEQLEQRPHVVFVTAYDHYATQASGSGALDFLLKPVDPDRLGESLQKALPCHRD
ncbi:MAG: response regulator [Syntrophorhabdaceae bacterium]|nr:response regulator [Syntrophorhabdaceae bacterium]